MATSANTIRDAQPKAVEAGSQSSGIPDVPRATHEPEHKGKEQSRKNVPEDVIHEDTGDESSEESEDAPRLTGLPEIPTGDDLKFDFESFSFMTPTSEVEEKVYKRASNVLKLTQENEKLQAKLKAMAEQLEAMERLRGQLAAKEQKIVEKSS